MTSNSHPSTASALGGTALDKAMNKRRSTLPASFNELDQARESSLFIDSLEKGLHILQIFDRERSSLGWSEIVAASGLDKSSVQRATFTLHALGFLKRDPRTRKYSLSARTLVLGFTYLQTDGLLEHATPLLYQAANKCGESMNITELLDTEVVYVARVPAKHAISGDLLLGGRMPAFATAPGRAMMAFLDEDNATDILRRSLRHPFTPKTTTGLRALRQELAKIRRQGYAIAEEQCFVGEISAAAPIFDISGHPIAAINVSIPTSRWSVAQVEKELVPLVQGASTEASHVQSLRPPRPWFAQQPQRQNGLK